MDGILGFIGIVSWSAAVFTVGGFVGRYSFRDSYQTRPYCESDTAEVAGKSITLQRCWKVVEVPTPTPEEK